MAKASAGIAKTEKTAVAKKAPVKKPAKVAEKKVKVKKVVEKPAKKAPVKKALATKQAVPKKRIAKKPVEPNPSYPPETWYMAGTENSGEYCVVAASSYGRVGIRELGNDQFRVRLEPTEQGKKQLATVFTPTIGWKQPDDFGHNRFSIVVEGMSRLKTQIYLAIEVLAIGENFQLGFAAPAWAKSPVGTTQPVASADPPAEAQDEITGSPAQ